MKILLTDDSAFMRTIIKVALKDTPNVEFMEAENGDVAVELYRNYRFDVTFLDIIMPVKNGIMAMEEIRAINPEAKIIFVTSISQDEMVQKAEALKANAFLAKPFQPEQIREVFNKVVSGEMPAGAVAPTALTAPATPAAPAQVVPEVIPTTPVAVTPPVVVPVSVVIPDAPALPVQPEAVVTPVVPTPISVPVAVAPVIPAAPVPPVVTVPASVLVTPSIPTAPAPVSTPVVTEVVPASAVDVPTPPIQLT